MRTLRIIVSVLLPLLSVGCVASPVFMATSSAGDNVTYSETGKSMLDYALSEMLDGDCTLMHGFTRGQFCRDVSKSSIVDSPDAVQVGAAAGEAAEAAGGSIFTLTQVASVPLDEELAMPTRPAAAPEIRPPPPDEPRWAFVLGVFKEHEQAAELAAKLKPNNGVVSSVIVRGEVFYRVTTQPFKLNQAADNEKPVAAIGIPDAKMVAVCPRWMRDETCLVLDR